MATTIEIKNISKHYKAFLGRGITKAVDDVSLSIGAGELFFLLGPSGCGKTTLLRMLAGFIDPTSGTIHFGGRDVTRLAPAKRNTGMVFQSYALWPHMTVEQNVAFGLSVRKVSKDETKRRVGEALELVHMGEYAQRKPNQLSGGQQQRVSLARALVVRPEVLLLDEPLSNLDAKLRLEMRSEIRRICKETNITTVYVTHDQKEALSMADRLAVMKAGVVAQVGPPREVYERPNSRFTADFLGETNFLEGQVVGAADRSGGVTVRTAAGDLRGVPSTGSFADGGRALCSIRPEALRLVNGATATGGRLEGQVVESTYLGDAAQYLVELKTPGGSFAAPNRVRVQETHPVATRKPGELVTLGVDDRDVVLVTE
ncbi:MAG TPA: ABC transporter ATP-binding protein [Phycisphaerales bacterium]|nr:ABC transporter ATP-binding protein [Phycisphaerales bacterium]